MKRETDSERRKRLKKISKTAFAKDISDRLFPDDHTWWELEMKNMLEVKPSETLIAPNFKAFGGSSVPLRRSSDQIPSPKRPRPKHSNVSSSFSATSKQNTFRSEQMTRSKQKKLDEEEDISLQMKEMSIDSPGILDERRSTSSSTGELGRLIFQSSMNGESMSLDFLVSSSPAIVKYSSVSTTPGI